jgi:hypothetical protein
VIIVQIETREALENVSVFDLVDGREGC